jgi:hypothetical protein
MYVLDNGCPVLVIVVCKSIMKGVLVMILPMICHSMYVLDNGCPVLVIVVCKSIPEGFPVDHFGLFVPFKVLACEDMIVEHHKCKCLT